VLEPVRSRRRTARLTRFARPARSPVLGLNRTPDRSIRLSRMLEGDELDVNAMIENAVQQRAGVALDGRIFCRHGRRRRSTAIVLLMDLSASTDRFVPGSFTRVIELEKHVATVIAEALDPQRDRVKDFDEPFDAPQRARLAALTSRLSTRMGAALRHAAAALSEETADHKVILVLTDGEPSDIDVVEDEYLVEDAREAVASAAAQRIGAFCVTLDGRADPYARRIFGARNYVIAERISTFTDNMSKTLARLLAS
jgi:nitric oxide reductase NorD protein